MVTAVMVIASLVSSCYDDRGHGNGKHSVDGVMVTAVMVIASLVLTVSW